MEPQAAAARRAPGHLSISMTASSPLRTPSPAAADSKRRSETAWQAIEDRVASQVAGLQQKQQAEQLDVDRVLRSSISRLEARLRSLEGQGVRADRRAAELAGLAQALTEEQRALLLRLDRVEEQLRVSRQRDSPPAVAGEEWLRRITRIEREQRAAALNLRLVVSVTEEAQQRQHQRMRSLEELADGRFRAVEERLGLRPQERLRSSASEPQAAAAASTALGPEAVGASVAGLLSQLRAQSEQDYPTALSQQEGASRLEVAELQLLVEELGRSLTPRADALDARVRGLQDTVEELRSRLDSLSHQEGLSDVVAGLHALVTKVGAQDILLREVSKPSQVTAAGLEIFQRACVERLRELEQRLEAVTFRTASDDAPSAAELARVAKRVEEQALVLADVQARVAAAGALNPELQLRQAEAQAEVLVELQVLLGEGVVRPAQLEELFSRTDANSEALQQLTQKVERVQKIEELESSLRRVEELAARLEALQTDTCPLGQLAVTAEAVEELRCKVQELPSREQLMGILSQGGQIHLEQSQVQVRQHAAALEELRQKISSLAATGASAAAVSQTVAKTLAGHEMAIADLKERLEAKVKALEAQLGQLLTSKGSTMCSGLEQIAEGGTREALSPLPEGLSFGNLSSFLEAEVTELRTRCNSLQEVIDQRLLISLMQLEKQVPEALSRVQLLLNEQTERLSKIEEHDVRLNIALMRLTTQEQKVHSCLDKVERLPSLNQVRSLWRDELERRLGEQNLEGLSRTMDLQAQALDELGTKVQDLLDRLSFGGVHPSGWDSLGVPAASTPRCRTTMNGAGVSELAALHEEPVGADGPSFKANA